MSDTTASLRRKISSAGDLQSVVRTMKALAASSIGQYEKSVHALGDYYRTVELGLGACFRESEPAALKVERKGRPDASAIGAIVFGSDQGLVGQFNDVVADYAIKTLAALPGKPKVWAVGERVQARLADAGAAAHGTLRRAEFRQGHHPPRRADSDRKRSASGRRRVRAALRLPQPPAVRRALRAGQPAAVAARRAMAARSGQSCAGRPKTLPEVMGGGTATLRALIREYLFISLFRACAESLASENASRLAAMQRADKNIDELLETLHGTFHRLRQSEHRRGTIRRDLRFRSAGERQSASRRNGKTMSTKIKSANFRVPPGDKLKLGERPTKVEPFFKSKRLYHKLLEKHVEKLSELQRKHYASNRYAILLIFQAMDAAGKDGAIRHVMSGINPQGCQVFSFKQPSAEDLEHDFLWRTTRCLPERGRIGIFNRSYYEEVLIVRVHPEILRSQRLPKGLMAKQAIWEERYRSIVDLEAHLHRNGTRIIKFFLHLSKDEQRKRFIARIDEPDKNWKFSLADVRERKRWEDYMEAYEACLNATSTAHAPWYVVPADDKKNARLIVSQIIVDTMEELRLRYPKVGKERLKELQGIRKEL